MEGDISQLLKKLHSINLDSFKMKDFAAYLGNEGSLIAQTLQSSRQCMDSMRQALGELQSQKLAVKMEPCLRAAQDFTQLSVSLIYHLKKVMTSMIDLYDRQNR